MLAIVAHHSVVNSGLLDVMRESPLSGNSLFSYLFGVWGKTGINCFVMITGYFMCKSEITLKKFLKLIFQVYFYSIVINLLFIITGYARPSLSTALFTLLPVQSFSSNFISCFLVYYLCIPFLNILIEHLKQKEHLLLVLLLVVVYTIIGSLPLIGFMIEYISWFAILHLMASYIRIYGFPVKITHVQWGLISLGFVGLSCASILALLFLGKTEYWDYCLNSPNKFFAFATSVALFMWFKGIKIPQSKLINKIAVSAFGVLLIHANNDSMRQWLWNDVLNITEHYYAGGFILYMVLSVLGIYLVCTIIDQLRIMVFEPLFKWMDNHQVLDRLQGSLQGSLGLNS